MTLRVWATKGDSEQQFEIEAKSDRLADVLQAWRVARPRGWKYAGLVGEEV